MRALQYATAAAVALLPSTGMAFALAIPDVTLTLAAPASTDNTLNLTVDVQPHGLASESQSKTAAVSGDCSATLDALFDPTSRQATISDIAFNLGQPGQISLPDTQFAYSWSGLSEDVNTSGVKFSPDTAAPPTPISSGLFAANQQSAVFNAGSLVLSGLTGGTQNLAASPIDTPNIATSSGTVAISAPTMNGNMATYTATVTAPLSVDQAISGTGYTGQLLAGGTIAMSGTFQFDFGPRVVNWNAAAGDFSAGGDWDVGFAPRSGDTAAIPNGASTLATAFSGSPAAVWVGDGAATSGTLTLAAGGSLSAGAMVLGQSSGSGTLILDGGTLSAPSIVEGAGGKGSLYFEAGRLLATAGSQQLLAGLGSAFVGAGGATFDSNGFDVSIDQALEHDPALGAARDGGLLKIGGGVLTLSGSDSYTGGMNVEAGALILASYTALPDGGELTVGGEFIFDPSKAGAAIAGSSPLAVPEPGTLALLAITVCGAAVYRRLRSRRKLAAPVHVSSRSDA